jgi:hypothetical protein
MYIFARTWRWFSCLASPPEAGCIGLEIIENSDSAALSWPIEPRENSDSDMAGSLEGGGSLSEGSSPAGEDARTSLREDSKASDTEQQRRVLMSSMTASVNISCGTRVVRLAGGTLTAALSVAGGGR